MKPLPTALPLEEEIEVWRALAHRERFRVFGPYGILGKIRESDRRDAELMLQAQEIAQFGPAAIQLFGIDCRGWTCDQLMWLDAQSDERQV